MRIAAASELGDAAHAAVVRTRQLGQDMCAHRSHGSPRNMRVAVKGKRSSAPNRLIPAYQAARKVVFSL
jgi:hypothetical protein